MGAPTLTWARRWRAPVVLVLLGALALRLGLEAAAGPVGFDALDAVNLWVVAGLLVWLAADDPGRARRLAVAALVVAGLGLLATAGFAGYGLRAGSWYPGVDTLAGLLGPAVAVAVLIRLARTASAVPEPEASAAIEESENGSPEQETGTPAELAAAAPAPYADPAGWEPTEAAGAAWTSAGAAAAGAAASGWGRAGETRGWEPGAWPVDREPDRPDEDGSPPR